jgi:membrane protease YdiL (CAAX protease family)
MLSEKPWRPEAVIQLCAAQVGCLFLGAAAIGLLQKLGVHGFRHDESFGNVVIGTTSFQGASWLLILVFLRQHQTGWREAFGFRGPRLFYALVMAVAFMMVVLPLVLGLQATSIQAMEKLGWPAESQEVVKLLTDAKSRVTTTYLGVFAVVFAPVAEEFIFRGMLFPFIKQLGFPKLAWFGVSFLFALIHLNAPTFVPLFVLALALTWLYEITDNLLAPITAHALFNAANLVLFHFQEQVNQLLDQLNHFLNLT